MRDFTQMDRLIAAVETIAANTAKPAAEAITDEERAILVMMRMAKPTKRKIARVLGYKSHAALSRFKLFNEVYTRWQIALTVRPSEGRAYKDHTDPDEVD